MFVARHQARCKDLIPIRYDYAVNERGAVQQSVIPALSRNPVPGGAHRPGGHGQAGHLLQPVYGGIAANWY